MSRRGEKPQAVTEEECERMIEACRTHRVKLMVAYRLHFEEINLKAIELVRKGGSASPVFSIRRSPSQCGPATSARRRKWARWAFESGRRTAA
jgi:predicted dehydrogenase